MVVLAFGAACDKRTIDGDAICASAENGVIIITDDPLSGVVGETDDARYRVVACARPISSGSSLFLTLPGIESPDGHSLRPTVSASQAGKVFPVREEPPEARCPSPSRSHYVVIATLPEGLPLGRTLDVEVKGYRLPLRSVADMPVSFAAREPGDNSESLLGKSVGEVRAAPAAAVLVDIPSAARTNEPIRVRASAVDAYGNPAAPSDGKLIIEVDGRRPEGLSPIILGSDGMAETAIPAMPAGPHRVSLIQGTREAGRSGPCLVSDEPAEIMPLWGDLHSHTGFSDAFTTAAPRDAFRYARKTAHLDFAAVTDHPEAVWGCPMSPQQWETTKLAVQEADDEPSFTALLGFEWTGSFPFSKAWPANAGHMNVLFPNREGAPCGVDAEECGTAAGLVRFAEARDAIAIQHHAVARWAPADFSLPSSSAMPVIEIFSSHGSSECLDCPRSMPDHVAEAGHAVWDALLRGTKLGIVGSTDNHHARPGSRAFPDRRNLMLDAGGAACVLAPENTRAAIFTALRERRCYATTGERILLDFHAGPVMMGGEIGKDVPAAFMYRVYGTDTITNVQILRGDPATKDIRVAYNSTPDRLDAEGAWKDEKPAPGVFYYLRVTQMNGGMAWSSPIWISR